MAKNSIDAYGASGKTNVLMFEPEKLHWLVLQGACGACERGTR
ncbi:hypothetical protein [Klebsiella quasipneumoniae]|nr:hypothetical protein [Klebsiella quasipneumoniae]